MKDRSIEILRMILNSYLPLSFNYLSDEFGVSTRTIRNEVDEINDYLTERTIPKIISIRSEGLVLRLTKDEEDRLKKLINSVSDYFTKEERMLDILLSVALEEKPTYLFRKQEFYKVSKSTVDDDMRNLRLMLNEYNIEIMSIPKKGLALQGKERAIRTMIYSLINKFTNGLTNLSNTESNIAVIFNHYIEEGVYLKIDSIFDKRISDTLEDVYRKNAILLICIWLTRIELGYRVTREDLSNTTLPYERSGELCEFILEIKKSFLFDVPTEEEHYIIFVLQSLIGLDQLRNVDWVQSQMITIQLIEYVEEYTRIPFSRKETLLQSGIYNHLKSMILRLKNNIHLNNPLTATIKKSYGEIFSGVKAYFSESHERVFNSITDDEVAYITIHFSAALSVINQENKYWYRVVVICNHGVATGKLLAEKLKELFSIEVLGVFSSREIEIIKKLDVDLVFSTVELNIDFLPCLKVDPIINENSKTLIEQYLLLNKEKRRLRTLDKDYTTMFQDVVKLINHIESKSENKFYEKLENIFNKNNLKLNKKELQPMIQDILLDSDIQIKMKAASWEESIINVSQPLLNRGIIKESYIDAMIESVKEFGPYIVLAPHFALAHARPDDGANEVGLSIATLEKGVNFGNLDNDPVTVIFCLSAIDSHSHLNIMKEIINLINDPKKIELISSVSTVEELKKILVE